VKARNFRRTRALFPPSFSRDGWSPRKSGGGRRGRHNNTAGARTFHPPPRWRHRSRRSPPRPLTPFTGHVSRPVVSYPAATVCDTFVRGTARALPTTAVQRSTPADMDAKSADHRKSKRDSRYAESQLRNLNTKIVSVRPTTVALPIRPTPRQTVIRPKGLRILFSLLFFALRSADGKRVLNVFPAS
jgi:hypothetical protein